MFCAGFPDQQFFKDYLIWKSQKLHTDKIFNFIFRTKIESWDNTRLLSYYNYTYKNKVKEKYAYFKEEPYFHSFLRYTHHLNKCYNCKYSKQKRVSDISIGDCWGIQDTHLDFYNSHKHEGISAVFLNTNKSLQFFDTYCKNKCTYITSSYKNLKQNVVDDNINIHTLINENDIKEKETIDKMLRQGKNLEVFDYILKNIHSQNRKHKLSNFCYNIYKPLSFPIPDFIKKTVKKKLT